MGGFFGCFSAAISSIASRSNALGNSHWNESAGIQVMGEPSVYASNEDEASIRANEMRLDTLGIFPILQPTGIAVSESGQVFISFPRWDRIHRISVAVLDQRGGLTPFPSKKWNEWEWGWNAGKHFVSVQALWADGAGSLWILDAANPFMAGTIAGGAKLLRVDIERKSISRVYPLDYRVIPGTGYVSDFLVDQAREFAYITEPGGGALIVVDLESGEAKRVLENHASMKAEDLEIRVEGTPLRLKGDARPHIHVSAITLSPDGKHLYYQALSGRTLYRIATEPLRDFNSSDSTLANAVQRVAQTVVSDGMVMDDKGRIYFAAVENNAVAIYDPDTRAMSTLIENEAMKWPTALAFGPDGSLHIASSLVHLMPRFNEGLDLREDAYQIFRLRFGPAAPDDYNPG